MVTFGQVESKAVAWLKERATRGPVPQGAPCFIHNAGTQAAPIWVIDANKAAVAMLPKNWSDDDQVRIGEIAAMILGYLIGKVGAAAVYGRQLILIADGDFVVVPTKGT